MPVYVYRATDPDGIEITATIEAESAQMAIAALKGERLRVYSVEDTAVVGAEAVVPKPNGGGIFDIPPVPEPVPWTDLPEPGRLEAWEAAPVDGILAQKLADIEDEPPPSALPEPASATSATAPEAVAPREAKSTPQPTVEAPEPSIATSMTPQPRRPPRNLAKVTASAWAPGTNLLIAFGLVLIVGSVIGTIIGLVVKDSAAVSDYMPIVVGGTAVLLIGVIAAGTGSRRRNRIQHALAHGLTVTGRVISLSPNPRKASSTRTVIRVRYEFTGPLGRVYGSVSSSDPSVRALEKGDTVWVVYDPSDPRANALWPPR